MKTTNLYQHVLEQFRTAWSDYKDNRVLHMYGKEHTGPCPLCDEALTDSNKDDHIANASKMVSND